VRDFDPQGTPPEENPDLAALATDGKPGTAWRTSTYYDPLEEQKSGVGLLVDLGRPTPVSEVRLTLLGTPTPDRPTALQILAAPDADVAPTGSDGLTRVAADGDAGNQVDLALAKDVTTRWVVVWFTRLPTVPGGFQGRVAEISVRS
jgi:putative peptidoglycan lipid II flippase